MTLFYPNLLSIAILDFKRENESSRLLDSLKKNLKIDVDIVYCHDGPPPLYVYNAFNNGEIDTLIFSKIPQGCGIQTRQLFQACMTPYILYCQVDQYLVHPFTEEFLKYCVDKLESEPNIFYIDLAGNQGNGRPSERALLMRRKDYLNIPDIDNIVGGPGPLADKKWTEEHLQDYMRDNKLIFATVKPTFFIDNGGDSKRINPDGSEWMHYTDTKQLWLLKGPVKERFIYPKFTDKEWALILSSQKWPDGQIPENEKSHSFNVWH